jgi:hypothetical protein
MNHPTEQPPELTAERLEELKALMALASPLPWPDPDTDEDFTCSEEEMQHNRRFIWALCNNAGALFAQLHSLRSELAASISSGEYNHRHIATITAESDSLRSELQEANRCVRKGTEQLVELRSELATAKERIGELEKHQWQDISTAPKDGRRIMVVVRGKVQFAHWETQKQNAKPRPFWVHSLHMGERYNREHEPTHWQPLPEPPTSHSTKAEGESRECS